MTIKVSFNIIVGLEMHVEEENGEYWEELGWVQKIPGGSPYQVAAKLHRLPHASLEQVSDAVREMILAKKGEFDNGNEGRPNRMAESAGDDRDVALVTTADTTRTNDANRTTTTD